MINSSNQPITTLVETANNGEIETIIKCDGVCIEETLISVEYNIHIENVKLKTEVERDQTFSTISCEENK